MQVIEKIFIDGVELNWQIYEIKQLKSIVKTDLIELYRNWLGCLTKLLPL